MLLSLGLLGPVDSAEIPQEVWTSLASTSLELRLKDGTVLQGRILTVSDTTVTLILPGGEVVTSEKREVESIKRNSGMDRVRIATQEAGEQGSSRSRVRSEVWPQAMAIALGSISRSLRLSEAAVGSREESSSSCPDTSHPSMMMVWMTRYLTG
jgi:hypothetical protein